MIRIIEIYSRLNALDEFLALMLQQPDSYRERMISERMAALVEYVDHINAVMWRQQERGRAGFRILMNATYCPPFLKYGYR